MGTNYYWHHNECEHCGRKDVLHIGKQSFGWEFSFHGTDKIRSWDDWKKALRSGGKVVDEYDREINTEQFIASVEASRGPEQGNHYDYCLSYLCVADRQWKDAQGWSFSDGEFS